MAQISVCIITKNESAKLEKCLRALQPWGFELVVVDTGSTDGTKEMAEKYTGSIYEFPWCDDFAAAKNYAVSKASHDMVLVIDSDEYLQPLTAEQLERLGRQPEAHPGQVGRIRRVNHLTRGGETQYNREWINRLFDRREFHYEGRIHEQIVPGSVFASGVECVGGERGAKKQPKGGRSGKHEASYGTYLTELVIDHDGYEGEGQARRDKARRNIRLLEQEFERDPKDTYVMYQLGKSCYMAGDYPGAVRYFELALGYDLDPKLEYVIDMVETYGYALLNCGQAETALQLRGVYDEFGGSADFKFLMGLVYMNNELFEEAVREFEAAAECGEARTEGVNSYLAYYNAGVIRECLGDVEQASMYYGKCGNYGKAQQRLAALNVRKRP